MAEISEKLPGKFPGRKSRLKTPAATAAQGVAAFLA
jgi:hypothetical protein